MRGNRSSSVLARLAVLATCHGILVIPGVLGADVIHLKDGGRMEVDAWRDVGDAIEISVAGGLVQISKDQIQRIDGQPTTGELPLRAAPPSQVPPPGAGAPRGVATPTDPQAEVRELIQQLQDPNPAVRCSAVEALGSHLATEAVPGLLTLLRDSDWCVRTRAARALGQIGRVDRSAAKVAFPALLRMGDEDAGGEQRRAIEFMAPAIVAELVSLLTGPYPPELRIVAAEALGKAGQLEWYDGIGLGPRAGETVRALIRALRDNHPGVRLQAANALASLGAVAREAIPALRQLAERESDAQVRIHAEGAVRNIEISSGLK